MFLFFVRCSMTCSTPEQMNYFLSQNKPHESAHIAVREAYAKSELNDRVRGLQVRVNVVVVVAVVVVLYRS